MKKKLFLISISLLLVYCLSAVCAADINSTCDNIGTEEENCIDIADQNSNDNIEISEETPSKLTAQQDYNKSVAGAENHNLSGIKINPPKIPQVYGPVYEDTTPDKYPYFNELQKLIYENSEITLYSDYKLNSRKTFPMNTNIVINGNGHTIDLSTLKSNTLKSIHGNIVLKNLVIMDGNCLNDGGGIYIGGDASLTLINCVFINNHVLGSGGAIFNANKNPLKIINCTFKNNHALESGGAIYSNGDVYIENCNFYKNIVSEKGIVYSNGNVKVVNTKFSENNCKHSNLIQCKGTLIVK